MLDNFHLTDMGNAERFQNIYGNKVRYLKDRGRFIQFDEDKGWSEAAEEFTLAKGVIFDMHREASECRDDGYRADLAKHAKDTESTTSQRNLLALVKDYVAVSLRDFDANPKVINCKNGIVDLADKTFQNHSAEYFHLNQANASYRPDATCHRWMSFLDEIFQGDKKLIEYVKVALGYSILGLTREHCFFLCHGIGRNGKGVLLETIQHVLGSYAHKTNFETFLQKDRSSSTRALEA